MKFINIITLYNKFLLRFTNISRLFLLKKCFTNLTKSTKLFITYKNLMSSQRLYFKDSNLRRKCRPIHLRAVYKGRIAITLHAVSVYMPEDMVLWLYYSNSLI